VGRAVGLYFSMLLGLQAAITENSHLNQEVLDYRGSASGGSPTQCLASGRSVIMKDLLLNMDEDKDNSL
jgi:hypothetical protein